MTKDPPIKDFIKNFLEGRGLSEKDHILHPIAADGSLRIFHRICIPDSGLSYIIMENPPSNKYLERENNAYLMIGKHLFKRRLPIPEILYWDLQNGWFILEDMGDRNLQDEITQLNDPIRLYEKVLEILFRFQLDGAQGFNPDWCCQTQYYDENVMRRFESHYFRDSFLNNYLGLGSVWSELEIPFDFLARKAARPSNNYFLHRDFQSRNIMISDKKIGILDWQGGRLGPLAYDLASLMIDPYPNTTKNDKDQIFNLYIHLLKDYRPELVDDFKTYFPYLAIQRNLQILGAFSYLTKIQKKPFFSTYISPALKSLHGLLCETQDQELLPLRDLVDKVLDRNEI